MSRLSPSSCLVLGSIVIALVAVVIGDGDVIGPRRQSTPEIVEVHLRADKKLSPVAAEVLARTFRVLYNDIVAGRIPLAQGKPEE